MTAEQLAVWLIQANFDLKKEVTVRTEILPESIGGTTGIRLAPIKKIELEDDRSIIITITD